MENRNLAAGNRKLSFALQFMLAMLSVIVLIAGVLSAVFMYNLYSTSSSLMRSSMRENIGRLQNHVARSFGRYVDLLDNTSAGVAALFEQGPIAQEDLAFYFSESAIGVPEVEMLYFANNTKWNDEDGYWASSPVWTPEETWDQTQRPWFLNAKEAAGAITFSEPYLDSYTGGIIISLSRTVYDRQGMDLGVAAADVLVTALAVEINRSVILPGQELYLLNKEGFYITNSDLKKVMVDNFFDDHGLDRLDYQSIGISTEIFHETVGDSDFYIANIPMVEWYLLSIVPKSVLFADINRMLLRFIIIVLLVLAACAFFSVMFTHSLLTIPLREIEQMAGSLAAMDFNVEFKKLMKGDMGDMQAALLQIRDSVKRSFMSFNQNASLISSAVNDLSSSATEITTTANEQSASVAEIVSTMESNKDLSEQVASKTQEVAELADQTQYLSQRGADLHTANEEMMLDIREQNTKIVTEIKNLHDVLSRIDESVQLIDAIADKTKLIAFNAALEASSSGEAGLRFAVVAGEIRRFADNVVESVVEIKERITELQNSSEVLISEADIGSQAINAGYYRMVEQKEVFGDIVDVSQNVASRSQQISSLSKQQEQASVQVFTALKEISLGIKQFVAATASTSATADSLNILSIELKETLAQYHDTKIGG